MATLQIKIVKDLECYVSRNTATGEDAARDAAIDYDMMNP